MFEIMTDTSANLDCQLLAERTITCIPFSFLVGGKDQMCTDTHAFDGKAFFNAMRAGEKVVTSQITPQRYIEYMRPALEQGHDILFVGMSSGISGAHASAQMAAAELREAFPERKLLLVDTLCASLGEGLLVLRGADLRDAGVSLKDTWAELDALRHNMCQVFAVDDLKYLRATGRLSGIKTVIASVLQIKPLLKGDTEGKIVCFAKTRGKRGVIQALAAEYDRTVTDAGAQTVGIAHADCPEDAAALAELLRRNHPPKDIMIQCYEPVTGSHVGPGTLALFFLGDAAFRSR